MDTILAVNAFHWLALGLLLLAAEALGAAGFLLGAAAAAFSVGLVMLFVPALGLAAQLGLFALAALLGTLVYLKVFRLEQAAQPDPGLNHPAARLVGHEFDLPDGLPGGTGRVQIGDTLWRVEAPGTLDPGTRVRVEDADGMSLRLARLE